ncbi:phosphatidylinositol 3-kinase [Ascodesmis nigricans]|uniref:Phosphatidylinositol 3-kinase VPS34 n=1 Tax=Ascodesmis nigricans TaxID=341454 RepID=A0A4S2N197_9PEZI|nr:phosphatidylinositol 3-kinase [Ascodesmis nigricans]
MEPYSVATTRQIPLLVNVRIDSLEGSKAPIAATTLFEKPELKYIGSNTSSHSDLHVSVQLFADSKPLTVPIRTAYKSFRSQRQWSEWLQLPIKYCDLPLSAQLAITVWDIGGPLNTIPFGGTTVRLFDKDNTLKKGRQKCKIWMGVEADGMSDTVTPSPVETTDEVDRLEKLMKKHELGEINRCDWLDNLVFRQLEKINKETTAKKQGEHYLYIDLPRWDFPVVFSDHEYKTPSLSATQSTVSPSDSMLRQHPSEISSGAPGSGGIRPSNAIHFVDKVYDPEVMRDNPVESMHRRLLRLQRNGPEDRDLKPNAKIRDELNEILNYSPTHELTSEEKDLVWKFRFYLTRDKRALTKFVKSVTWSDPSESKQAVSLVTKWTEVDIDDALELLGPEIKNTDVRAYAVDRLKTADDEELQLYLLQLVQALKFESDMTKASASDSMIMSPLAEFLISRASNNDILGNFFYWYLMVEIEDPDHGRKRLYSKVSYEFQIALRRRPGGDDYRTVLKRQGNWIFQLGDIAKELELQRDRVKKEEKLREILRDPKRCMLSFEPTPLPLDPRITMVGCYPEKSMVFKSSLSPLRLHIKTDTGEDYPVIFKSGDDLRQDQLVIQIVILMDRLLRKVNLDLKLTPYRILATSAFTGLVQFMESMSLAAIEEGKKTPAGVLPYLRSLNPDPSQPLGVKAEVMDTYVKSCAGYCVITYLLGVGDRHLDNLLLTPDGHFFHADFGYILGRDPKPFAPPMKLCQEMVAGMGGLPPPSSSYPPYSSTSTSIPSSSSHPSQYPTFRSYCFTAFTTLRKSANLILNLFALMVDANIPDIRLEPDKAVLKVKERFMLEMGEEEAVRRFGSVMDESLNAVLPVLMDRVHGIAQKWRR